MEGNKIENKGMDSSFELLTPVKTRSSTNKLKHTNITPSETFTRSGRKIKKIQYLEYQTGKNDVSYFPNNGRESLRKNSALKELNSLECEFDDLYISTADTATPKRERRTGVSEKNKMNETPKGKLISPQISYSKSGRKIKKIQYLENDTEASDLDNSINQLSGKKRVLDKNVCSNATPNSKSCSTPLFTRSGRKVKKSQLFEDEFVYSKSSNKQGSAAKRNLTFQEDNENINDSFDVFIPSKPRATNKTPIKVNGNENISPAISKSGRKIKKKTYQEKSDSELENSIDTDIVCTEIVKPPALYDDDNAVETQLFGFQTPKAKNAMYDKATKSTSKHTNVQKTPRSNRKKAIDNNNAKTPYNMRKRIKKGIVKEVSRQSIDALLEDSGSDYVPSSSSSDDDEESGSDEHSDSSEGNEISGVVPLERASESINQLLKKRTRAPINNFIFTAEDYFENKNLRSYTSNHTLSQLKTPRFNQFQLNDILKSMGNKHEKAIADLNLDNEAMFTRWLVSMNEGFSVLVYGVGSKKKLINTFHRQFLSRCNVVVINGYFPGLILKDILDCITNDVLKLRSVPAQPHDIVEFIGAKLRNKNNHLFLLVHNIDGTSLRCDKIQSILAHLAADPNIHLVASLDHINSPLLWDQNKLSQFNFTWEDGTSFLPYLDETSYESSLMVQQSGGIALAGLKNIFKSLNSNSRKIFKLLLEHQSEDAIKKSQGMLFSDLYRECRNSFLVSSDLALRTQLTEFFDHQLVKWKKDNEHLYIPLDSAILKQFRDYLNAENE